jgi:hypothetical protein
MERIQFLFSSTAEKCVLEIFRIYNQGDIGGQHVENYNKVFYISIGSVAELQHIDAAPTSRSRNVAVASPTFLWLIIA